MSAWLARVVGPLVDGDLCELRNGDCGRCEDDAVVIAQDFAGRELLLCEWHAERHGLLSSAVLAASCDERSSTCSTVVHFVSTRSLL